MKCRECEYASISTYMRNGTVQAHTSGISHRKRHFANTLIANRRGRYCSTGKPPRDTAR